MTEHTAQFYSGDGEARFFLQENNNTEESSIVYTDNKLTINRHGDEPLELEFDNPIVGQLVALRIIGLAFGNSTDGWCMEELKTIPPEDMAEFMTTMAKDLQGLVEKIKSRKDKEDAEKIDTESLLPYL